MAQFKTAQESHAHSRRTMDAIYEFDTFLDSLKVVADMGCGRGLDAEWWATLETRDDPPEPRNYLTYAIDLDVSRIEPDLAKMKNVRVIKDDFSKVKLPKTVDLIWCHDAFQYAVDPVGTLRHWNKLMTPDGMLVLILPQNIGYSYNRLVNRTENYCYHNHTVCNLIYMLAVNGFDCNDAYMLKTANDPWMHLAVYKSSVEPMDPAATSLYDLAEMKLLHPSVVASINTFGYLRQEDLVYPWLNRDWYRSKN